MPLKFFKDDTLPKFEFTVVDEDGDVVDLSVNGISTAKCFIREEEATDNKFSGADVNAVLVAGGVAGRIDYTMPSGGIDTVGRYTGQLELTFTAGPQQTERFQFFVEEGLKV